MALLTGWTGKSGYSGPDNKVVEEAPKTIRVDVSTYVVSDIVWRTYNDTTTEAFSYVGMTYAAALLCQAAMITAYTVAGVLVADVSVTRMSGRMWKCSVRKCKVATTTEVVE